MQAVPVDEQHTLDVAIGSSVLREMYQDDTAAELTVELGAGGVHARLVSDTQPGIALPNDLQRAVWELVGAHRRAGSGLVSAVYRYTKRPDGKWMMAARWSYAKELTVSPSEVPELAVEAPGEAVLEFPDGVVVQSFTLHGVGHWMAEIPAVRELSVRAVEAGHPGALEVITSAGPYRFRLSDAGPPVPDAPVMRDRYRVTLA